MEGLLSTIYDVFLDQIVDGQIYTKELESVILRGNIGPGYMN